MNQFNFIGRAVSAPRYFTNKDGSQTALLTLAIPRDYKDADGNAKSDFVSLQGYIPADKANTAHKYSYVRKGMLLAISGSVRSYVSEHDGNKTYGTSFSIGNINFLESKAVVEARENAAVKA